jgi:two-component sensor histidine kinase
LLVNACKYAFPPESDADRKTIRGAIGITATAKDGVLRLTIHDNGVGIPQAILDGERPGGLGLTIVRSLAQQLKGSLILSRASDSQGTSGTSVVLEFPQT